MSEYRNIDSSLRDARDLEPTVLNTNLREVVNWDGNIKTGDEVFLHTKTECPIIVKVSSVLADIFQGKIIDEGSTTEKIEAGNPIEFSRKKITGVACA